MFIYTIKTMNLFNLTFIPNVNYMIRSEKNITFSFKGVEYTLFGNKLVEEIEIVSYPKYTEKITDIWNLTLFLLWGGVNLTPPPLVFFT